VLKLTEATPSRPMPLVLALVAAGGLRAVGYGLGLVFAQIAMQRTASLAWGAGYNGLLWLLWGAYRLGKQLPGWLFASMVATIVVQQVVFISCDAVWLLLRLRPRRWPPKSPQWWAFCIAAWMAVLAPQWPFVGHSMRELPVLLVWAQTAILSRAYRTAILCVLGGARAAATLSVRCQSAQRRQADLVQGRSGERTFSNGWAFGFFLFCYAHNAFEALHTAGRWTLLAGVYIIYLQFQRITKRRVASQLTYWKLLFTLTSQPVHACCADLCDAGPSAGAQAGAGEECDQHGTCAVCLDSLCAPVEAVAEGRSAIWRRRRPAMSMCRRQPWTAAAGSSAYRAWGVQLCRRYFSGFTRATARLPCGHEFHLGCIDDVVKTRLQCPTCRGCFGDQWEGFAEEEYLCVRIGCLVVALAWLALLWAGPGVEAADGAMDALAKAADSHDIAVAT